MASSPVIDQNAKKEKTDQQIQADVIAELEYEPVVRQSDFGVVVKGGVVTLSGSTASHGAKWHAVRAAKRVVGVKAIAEEINVNLGEFHQRTDADIATAVVHQLEWSTTIPAGSTKVTVRNGWIILEGVVEWQYQKNAAEDVLQYMIGVKGINNLITVKPLISVKDLEQSITAAFDRNAMLDAKKIEVETRGSTVVLRGKVANNAERDEAERVAWAATGVLSVDNQISLEWNWGRFF